MEKEGHLSQQCLDWGGASTHVHIYGDSGSDPRLSTVTSSKFPWSHSLRLSPSGLWVFLFSPWCPKAHHCASLIAGVQQNAKCNETFSMFSQTHRSNSRPYVMCVEL